MQNLYNDVAKLLEKDERFFAEGKILKNAITEAALKLDSELLNLLLTNSKTKDHFFMKATKSIVFDQDKFVKFVNNKEFLPNSFTGFKNHIGLAESDEYLKDSGKVILAWPYKDCVLEGGQDKEDAKRNEVFYNETLAPDEIDRLFEPKVLTNIKKIDKTGEHKVEQITERDNLIIKGNNLLALHSLKKNYRGKVKLIYIDPPYNTGNDGFNYNDSFNHSTWLVFMKNRLQIARELLKNDGVIFVHIDWNENHYLKVLMDEVFGRENFINEIVWKRRGGSMNQPNCFGNVVDYILFYAKTSEYDFNPATSLENENTKSYIKERFVFKDKDGRVYMKSPLISPKNRPNLKYEYRGYKAPENGWLVSLEKMERWDKEGRLIFPEDKNQRISRKIYLDEYRGQPINCLWTDIFVINPMSKESRGFVGQKPEELLKRIIETSTNKGDLVLDYHAGSGTTLAVAQKIGRQYIGVEQLDYKDKNPETRVKSVIRGDQSGISKTVGWKGGGSFIYAELKQWNEGYIRAIRDAKTTKELASIYKKMQAEAFFRYEIDLSKFDQKQFAELSLDEQKKVLMGCLDKNHLYVNYGEMEDATYKIPTEERKINKAFYGN